MPTGRSIVGLCSSGLCIALVGGGSTLLDILLADGRLPVPVIGVAEEAIVFTNQAAEAAFGSGAGSLLVRRLGEAFSAQLGEAVGRVRSGQAPAEFGYTHRGGDGYRAVCAPLPGPEHHGGAVICLIKHDGPERGAGLADLNTDLDTTGENKEGPGRPHGGPDA